MYICHRELFAVNEQLNRMNTSSSSSFATFTSIPIQQQGQQQQQNSNSVATMNTLQKYHRLILSLERLLMQLDEALIAARASREAMLLYVQVVKNFI
jgi:hypothetical protein